MDIGSKGVKSDINVTPLVDVVLVLLIIFMVITPLLQRGKAVVLPRARNVSELRRGGDPIIVSVTRDGKVWVDKTEVPRESLSEVLQGEFSRLPGHPVMVKGDADLEYKKMRELILEISKTRVLGISLAAHQIKEGEGP
jgi:biopolymer transport protein ExbD/biopolymer transport protein TolR